MTTTATHQHQHHIPLAAGAAVVAVIAGVGIAGVAYERAQSAPHEQGPATTWTYPETGYLAPPQSHSNATVQEHFGATPPVALRHHGVQHPEIQRKHGVIDFQVFRQRTGGTQLGQ